MASEKSNRKVSTVFITLANPHQIKVQQKDGTKKGWVHVGPSQKSTGSLSSTSDEISQMTSSSASRTSVQSGRDLGMQWDNQDRDLAGSPDVFSPPPLPSPSPRLPPSPPPELHSYPPKPHPTPSPPSVQKPVSRPPISPQSPPPKKEVEKQASSNGMTTNKQPNGIKKDKPSESRGLCGFCQKPILFSESASTALKKIYHKSCFRCKTCSCPLAGKTFYHEAEVPQCEECHEKTLECCWSCGQKIRERQVRALQRVYHPTCFTCVTCKQPLENFIQADTGELYCQLDYARKFAKKCSVCHELIIGSDGNFPEHIESEGRIFHKECFRCEVCNVKFSVGKDGGVGCYTKDGKRLCRSCCS
ncbi:filamin-binding LIM protein 1 [Syngnathus scovelli]|uniref:filamin-binding LIM protein 1 n=1 Tax=Syngnathus scovelli TaxID=161590 RepID=UPI00210FD317|nr:filamin-binding LIM protein 1 [Syngnathus scovelli]